MSQARQTGELARLLESLVDGTGASQFEARLREARFLDSRAVHLFQEAHARLQSADRREALLRILNDTATDLTRIRNTDASLKAIVRRTRALIGADIAYISVNNPVTQQSYVRVTDGATTQAFRNIRVPIGGGVLGAVATGAAPAQSSDYLSDQTKSHFPESDAAVAEEQVRAIMGVPLWAGDSLIGALMVADRHAHEFSNEQVAVLEAISSHAAVALENARLFTELTQGYEQLKDLQRERLTHLQRLETNTHFDFTLMRALASRDVLESLLAAVTDRLGQRVCAIDVSGESLGGEHSLVDLSTQQARSAIADSLQRQACVVLRDGAGEQTLLAIAMGQTHLATLIVPERLVGDGPAALERASLAFAVALLFNRTLYDAQYRLQHELLEELLEQRPQTADGARRRARRFRLQDGARMVVHVVSVADEDREVSVAKLRGEAAEVNWLVSAYESHVCIIEAVTAADTGKTPAARVLEVLAASGITATAGSSLPRDELQKLPDAYREALTVLQALLALARTGQSSDLHGLGTAGLLLGASGQPSIEGLLTAQLGPLLAYDAQRGSALALTAWTYLESGVQQSVAARALHIHTNTLRQRLDRIDQLLGSGWRVGRGALDTHIALQLWRLKERGALPHDQRS